MKYLSIAASLLSLALLDCARAPTLLVTVENMPASATSLQVLVTHGGLAAIMDLQSFDLTELRAREAAAGTSTTTATASFLLQLPASFSGDVGVNVGAFQGTGLLASGANSSMMFMAPDDTIRVPLAVTPAPKAACSTDKLSIISTVPTQAATTGGQTITLNGWGFKPGAKVGFGSSKAGAVTYTPARSVTYVSASQLQVVTPATTTNFGETAIQVTNPDTNAATCPGLFNFYAGTVDFGGLQFQKTGDFSSANGFVFGLFNPATTLDAAVTQPGKDYVRILLTTGTITSFVDYTALPMGSKPTGITSGDFDQDGKLDVAVATQGDSMVRILLNDGTGIMTQSGIAALPANGGAEAIASADLNGDGNVDVVVANRLDNSITILFGNGKGGFASQSTVTSLTDPISLSIGDLNFDGQPDIAIAGYSTGMVTLLFNDGGNFQGKYTKATEMVGNQVSSVLVTDVNNDGKKDVLAAATGDNKIVLIINMGLPNITQYTLTTEAGPRAVLAGDLNGDGYPDLAVPCNGTDALDVFLNQGGAGFMAAGTKAPFQTFPALCVGPAQAALYDIDRDGRLDAGVLCTSGIGLLINHSGL